MPHAIAAHFGSKHKRIYFDRAGAQLPVLRKDGSVSWLLWGARAIETTKLSHARVARLTDIRAQKKWRAYHPHPCIITAKNFMVLTEDEGEQWISLADYLGIHGVLAKFDDEMRVYPIVVRSIPEEYVGLAKVSIFEGQVRARSYSSSTLAEGVRYRDIRQPLW